MRLLTASRAHLSSTALPLAAALLLLTGCDLFVPQETGYRATSIPNDVRKLFVSYGDSQSDTVWLLEQGGPVDFLFPQSELLRLFGSFPNHERLYIANVHQTLTLEHSDLTARAGELSVEQLKAEIDVSVEILYRTIQHFKRQGKQVIVVGVSHGAFLVARFLALKGPLAAEAYVIMAGRLDMPEAVARGFLNGCSYRFRNGVEPERKPECPTTEPSLLIGRRLNGAVSHDRYSEMLASTNLSRVVYVYGTADAVVGRLTEGEHGFLESRGSTVIAIPGGEHDFMLENPELAVRIVEEIRLGGATAGREEP